MRRLISIWTRKTTDKPVAWVNWKHYLAFFTVTFPDGGWRDSLSES